MVPCRKIRSPYLGKAQQPQEQRYLFLLGCAVFLCPDNGTAASAWDFLTCAQMLMHAIAHGGCTDTVRESAQEVDCEKSPLPHRVLVSITPDQYYSGSITAGHCTN